MSGKRQNGKNYPWDKWLKPKTFRTLKHGRDYTCTDITIRNHIYFMATQRKLKVTLELPKPGVIKLTVHKG